MPSSSAPKPTAPKLPLKRFVPSTVAPKPGTVLARRGRRSRGPRLGQLGERQEIAPREAAGPRHLLVGGEGGEALRHPRAECAVAHPAEGLGETEQHPRCPRRATTRVPVAGEGLADDRGDLGRRSVLQRELHARVGGLARGGGAGEEHRQQLEVLVEPVARATSIAASKVSRARASIRARWRPTRATAPGSTGYGSPPTVRSSCRRSAPPGARRARRATRPARWRGAPPGRGRAARPWSWAMRTNRPAGISASPWSMLSAATPPGAASSGTGSSRHGSRQGSPPRSGALPPSRPAPRGTLPPRSTRRCSARRQ